MDRYDIKRYFQVLLLILAGGVIYPMLYLREGYQLVILSSFDLTINELNQLYIWLGVFFVLGYIPSGCLADRFTTKKLLVVSLVCTGLIGIIYAQIPPKEYLTYIYIGWGISTLLCFWGAFIKTVKILSRDHDSARIFGTLDGVQGLIGGVLGITAFFIFSSIVKVDPDSIELTTKGFSGVVYLYSFVCISVGILLAIFLDKDNKLDQDRSVDFADNLKFLKIILRNKRVWYLSIIIMTGYTGYWTTFYYASYTQEVYNLSPITTAFIGNLIIWMRPVGGITFGILADKYGKEKILRIIFILFTASLVLITQLTPWVSVKLIIILFASVMTYAIKGLYWSLLDDLQIPNAYIGIAIGFISFIGYLPDLYAPIIANTIVSFSPSPITSYNSFFLISAIISIIGIGYIQKIRKQ